MPFGCASAALDLKRFQAMAMIRRRRRRQMTTVQTTLDSIGCQANKFDKMQL
jgi:hypothetical protein